MKKFLVAGASAIAVVALLASCSSGEESTVDVGASGTTEQTAPEIVSNTIVEGDAAIESETDRIYAAFAAAGIETPNRTDATGSLCAGSMGCTRWTNTDVVDVIEWSSPEKAESWATFTGPAIVFVNPTTTLRFEHEDHAAYDDLIATLQ